MTEPATGDGYAHATVPLPYTPVDVQMTGYGQALLAQLGPIEWWLPIAPIKTVHPLGPVRTTRTVEPAAADRLIPARRPATVMNFGKGLYAHIGQLHHLTALTFPG